MSRVAVNERVLSWALARSGKTLDDLVVKFPKIEKWVAGENQPTLHQLEDLAKATYTPLGYFFLDKPPLEKLPIPHFRTLEKDANKKPSPGLLETVHTMQRRQAWMRDYLIEQGNERLPFVRSALIDEQPTLIAQRMRQILRFKEDWASEYNTWTDALRALREAMEKIAGILVVVNSVVGNKTRRKLDPTEFRGFVLVDEFAPLLFVNGSDGKAAQMFTLAHELAHIFFGSSAAFDLREMTPANVPTEQACNRVAAEFLVPENKLRQKWPSVKNDPEPFQTIARNFKVSAIVAARRALDLGFIKREAFFAFYDDYRSIERREAAKEAAKNKNKIINPYPTYNLRVGNRFALAVIRAVKEGKLLYSEAYHLTDLYGKTFDRFANRLGFGG